MPFPTPYPTPTPQTLEGQYCRLEPLNPTFHGDQFHEAIAGPKAERLHRYLPAAPPTSRAEFNSWLIPKSASTDPMFSAVIDRATNRVEGHHIAASGHDTTNHLEGALHPGSDLAYAGYLASQ